MSLHLLFTSLHRLSHSSLLPALMSSALMSSALQSPAAALPSASSRSSSLHPPQSRRPWLRSVQQWLVATILLTLATLAFADTRQYTVTAPDGVTLAVQESGNAAGPAIVFVHGLLGSHLSWDAQVNDPRLARYRLITFDLRGHGASGKPADAAAYTNGRRWADDLRAVITATHAQRPVVVGWSLGAAVTTNYLATYGDGDIAGAVYVGGVIELNAALITAHPAVYRDLVSPYLRTRLDANQAFVALCFATPPSLDTFQRLLANAALASPVMTGAVPSMTVEASKGLGAIGKPLLLIYGARDALVNALPSMTRAKALNARIDTEVYPDSGHAPFVEEADRFNRDLVRFVEANASR